ncbi:MAG: hypothetical protein ABI461_01295 [Polyangiaceae bacterium]
MESETHMYVKRSMHRRWILVATVLPFAVAFACGGSDDSVGLNGTDGGDSDDSPSAEKDATRTNPGDGAAPVVTTYNDFTDKALWQFYDFSVLLGQADANIPIGFLGAVFDGKYMYYTPTGHATTGTSTSDNYDMLRFDTGAAFDAPTSYSAVNLGFLGTGLAYVGATFDGRFVYPAPYVGAPFTRLDTKGSFGDIDASWNFGSTSTSAQFGAIFDGNNVYYAPISAGRVTRLDTHDGGLGTFDISAIDGGGHAYQGVVFDGRYAYFVPSAPSGPGNASHVLRLDTQADFNAPTSWTTFDTSTLDPKAQDFTGGVFDGRYLYLAPTSTNIATPTDVRFVRFDTKADFSKPTSWQSFAPMPDAQSLAYHTAGFDGRYVYYLPFVATGAFNLLRYDTTASFGDAAAWSSIDTTTFNPGATGYEGVGFDGRWIYLVPRFGKIGARFDAKSPSSIPPGFSGSFL